MALATGYKCDRCGKPCKDKHDRDVSPKVVESPNTQKGVAWLKTVSHDLCEVCWEQFLKFLDNQDVGKFGTSFREYMIPCPHHVPCADPDGCQGVAFKRNYK